MAKTLFLPVLWVLLTVSWFLQAAGGGSEIISFKISGKLRGGGDMEDHANYRALPLASRNGLFELLLYNIKGNAYALGISMGYSGQGNTKRIVWIANMNDLVTENSTLNLTNNGSLVISNANGSSVWSSNTSGRGVVAWELQNDGNLVLYNENNKTVWQSFDHPANSLLVGQSLNIGGEKLVSHVSEKDGSEGTYSLLVNARGLVLYSSNLTEKWTLPFHERGPRDNNAITHSSTKPVVQATFGNDPEGKHGCHHMIELTLANNTSEEETNMALYCLNTPGFNTNRSFLRVESDGELKIYSYSQFNKWDITYLRSGCWQGVPQYDLATKNGGSKVVPRSCQCVACGQADGFEGSGSCTPPSLADSKNTSSCNSSSGLYELEGPEHFSSNNVSANPNPIGETETEECRRNCSRDSYTCTAFSLWKQAPACLHTKELGNRTNPVFVKKTVNKV